ncbi:MAG: LysR family transcriptional regulator [Rhodocyclales bacterium]|nr:LysR family transcriptional regulator [Rhodocyclales bacterium]
MRRKIPGTDLLIAFETAARYQSFTRAAKELCLTQSAVCRQIGALEEFLNVRLFNRIKKRVCLSEAGEAYAKQVRDYLNRMEHDTLALMAHGGGGGVLELAVIPTFATRWLIPRLKDFHANFPGITLNLTTRAEPFMFGDTPFDAAIHFGDSIWPGAMTEYLFGEELVPVCSPALVAGRGPLVPEDLARLPLLHQSARPEAWKEFFGENGVTGINAMGGPRYELFSMLVEAAKVSLGVALMPRFFVMPELSSGELIQLCGASLHSQYSYYLVYPENKVGSASLQIFCQWLHEQAEAFRQASQLDSGPARPLPAPGDDAHAQERDQGAEQVVNAGANAIHHP